MSISNPVPDLAADRKPRPPGRSRSITGKALGALTAVALANACHDILLADAGAALLSDPDRLVACARAMVAAAGPGRVGVKLRLGPKPPDCTALR